MPGSFTNMQNHSATMRNNSRQPTVSVRLRPGPMKEGHKIAPQERVFLEAAAMGDKHSVMRCLGGSHPVNVNCTDILGRSALQIVVDNENLEIVEVLLRHDDIKIGNAVLYAIKEGVYRIVELLINHPSVTRDMLSCQWSKLKQIDDQESDDYSPDISPIILAAQCNQFEVLQLLLDRGACIERPHALTCSCSTCKRQMKEDSLRHSLLRIHCYRALASPAWMSLTSADPVLTAFKMSRELKILAMLEDEFKDIYAGLSAQCKCYACDLLEQCRSNEEVMAVLNRGCDSDDEDYHYESSSLMLSRLKLALKYEQKQFVAHPHCQQLLASIWYEGLPGWRKHHYLAKVCIIFSLICLMPLVALVYLLMPHSKLGRILRTPFMKFMYHSASFGVFLVLLILASTNVSTGSEEQKIRRQQRGPPPTTLELVITIYVLGFVWSECKQLWDEGFKAYTHQWWNWLDFIMLSLFLCAVSLRCVAFAQTYFTETYGPSYLPRDQWPDADPTLVSEGVFAIANVFSFGRIIFLFQANAQLGPLQISLGCMLIDIGKFLFIFFLVLTSFACGLNQLYYYYSEAQVMGTMNSYVRGSGSSMPRHGDPFENPFEPIWNSYLTLFWALFGLMPLSTVREGSMQSFTKRVGEILLMVYHIMAIIVLINMLIAMMSSSFQEIEDHSDREWKFARSKLWMGYFDEGSTLPPPFNLIISPKSVCKWLRAIKGLLCGCFVKRQQPGLRTARCTTADGTGAKGRYNISVIRSFTNTHVFAFDNVAGDMPMDGEHRPRTSPEKLAQPNGRKRSVPSSPDHTRYEDVMRRLVGRFIHQWKKKLRQDGVNEDDLLEIKQDISSLRYELREDRKTQAVHSGVHMDNLRKDILHTIRRTRLSPNTAAETTSPQCRHRSKSSRSFTPPRLTSSAGSAALLSTDDLDDLKCDIVASLRNEIRQVALEMAGVAATPKMAGETNSAAAMAPPTGSELYQTRLYTEL